ncbi:SNF2-related protein [Avibacterium sp. 21-586]|nr:SNF2-related protein [Avibacterium sp. 21-586]MCW9710309.1 SNF2-related protein [Avibacterium sp. 21-586]
MQISITPHQSQIIAWQLSRKAGSSEADFFGQTLADAQVDLNPHQVEAAIFACQNPLSKGVLLADEVGLGKTIEAGLVIAQRWAERKRRILIIVPANLRKQWHQELLDKFGLSCLILESKNYNALQKSGAPNPFCYEAGPVICSYPFAKAKADNLQAIDWDLVVMDEAHRLRNVYKPSNVVGNTLKTALAHVSAKVLLTATPLQNSLLELYGLTSLIDERIFGDLDSFKTQFGAKASEADLTRLRTRLAPVCKRTLRSQVMPYINYTARHAMVQEFTPSDQEKTFSDLVADYLRRPQLHGLPNNQRHLISLILWKLLASSSRAIAGTLQTIVNRLEAIINEGKDNDLALDDYENFDNTQEEWEEDSNEAEAEQPIGKIEDEIAELKNFIAMAQNIKDDAKGQALLTALDRAFAEQAKKNAPQKAIIFTESRKTQDYLLERLLDSPYGKDPDNIVLFNGDNSGKQATKIYRTWLEKHQNSDKITGSKTADTRAALVEHFRDKASIMIATEAGAEGINLQFCSLVINYDLPWNPQRVEQRIGRCHRYGQQHDVVVVNFLDNSNPADQRVYELLAEKFQLFDGVFGSSDEILGTIGSGVDIERRIADIYRHCREPKTIQAAFDTLQQELKDQIDAAIRQTRGQILENFDESVQERLNFRANQSEQSRNRYEQRLLTLTRAELHGYADFDNNGFTLHRLPENLSDIPLGRYELPRRNPEAHLYRISHPLAQAIIAQAKNRTCPYATLTFDYQAYPSKISSLEPYIGQSGQLIAKLITVSAFDQSEEHLIISAVTDNGEVLVEDDPEKMLKLPVSTIQNPSQAIQITPALATDSEQRQNDLLRSINQQNLSYFDTEIQKIDGWADDLKQGLEQEIKDIDRQIKEIRKAAAIAPTLEEKLSCQQQQRQLEGKRNKKRRELFDKQDEIDAKRDELIAQLQAQLEQKVDVVELFRIGWKYLFRDIKLKSNVYNTLLLDELSLSFNYSSGSITIILNFYYS